MKDSAPTAEIQLNPEEVEAFSRAVDRLNVYSDLKRFLQSALRSNDVNIDIRTSEVQDLAYYMAKGADPWDEQEAELIQKIKNFDKQIEKFFGG